MADFNPLDPTTFSPSKTNQSDNYAYRVAVIPKDPSTYTGHTYITVSSNVLLTTEQIIVKASQFIVKGSGRSNFSDVESIELVDAKFNSKSLGG